jgi:nicotinamidase/pyrazinamidase
VKRNIHFLLIDPQNDFCDLPIDYLPVDPITGTNRSPALPVAGAHQDMKRLAHLIQAGSSGIANITVTLDSHHRLDIAHPTFWREADGNLVAPFTQITAAQVREGRYQPRNPASLPRALTYLDELETRARYTLMVWPIHCEMGTWGHNVHADLQAAYAAWEEQQLAVVDVVSKGSNPWTEHYSAVQAEVPDGSDPDTQLNRALIETLDRADLIVVAGEASSHCVRATTEHVVANLAGRLERVVLLTDCMSPVGGFESEHDKFLDAMRSHGVRLATSNELLPEVLNNATAS